MKNVPGISNNGIYNIDGSWHKIIESNWKYVDDWIMVLWICISKSFCQKIMGYYFAKSWKQSLNASKNNLMTE